MNFHFLRCSKLTKIKRTVNCEQWKKKSACPLTFSLVLWYHSARLSWLQHSFMVRFGSSSFTNCESTIYIVNGKRNVFCDLEDKKGKFKWNRCDLRFHVSIDHLLLIACFTMRHKLHISGKRMQEKKQVIRETFHNWGDKDVFLYLSVMIKW